MIGTLFLYLAGMSYRQIFILGAIAGLLYYATGFDDGSRYENQQKQILADIEREKAAEKESEAALKEVDQVRTAVGALSDQFKATSQALPTEIQMSEVIRIVDAIASLARVSIKTKEPRQGVIRNVVEEVPLQLTVEGTYSQITQFLFYISNYERIMRIKKFSLNGISGNSKNSGSARLNFDGQILSYRFVPETVEKNAKDAKAKEKKK